MKKLIALISLSLAASAFARETVFFSYSGIEGWGQTYYSCDYVEAQTEKVLDLFGASQVRVDCTGGIEFGQVWPVSVTASFEVPALTGAEAPQTVKYRGDVWQPSCGVNVAIVKALLPKFSNVTVLKKEDSCAFASSNYSYEFSIKK